MVVVITLGALIYSESFFLLRLRLIFINFPYNYIFKPGLMLLQCTPPILFAAGEGCASDQIFKNGGLDRISVFREGLLGKRG